MLAHARLIAAMTGIAPILLLDEIVAHLDPSRRAALHQELAQLGTQVFMTGADPAMFVEVGDTAAMFEIRAGADCAAATASAPELAETAHGPRRRPRGPHGSDRSRDGTRAASRI